MSGAAIRKRLEALLKRFNSPLKSDHASADVLAIFSSDGAQDSVTALKLIMQIEEEFDITVEDHEIVPENFKTVSDLVRYVESKLT